MTVETTDWTVRLDRLVDELRELGKLTDPRWDRAFRSVPRHVFVPEFLEWQPQQHRWRTVSAGCPAFLEQVYSNVPLCVDGHPDGRWLSSTTTPGLMARMLEMLRIAETDRVLEIGTGTGYNTAVLTTLLGSDRVVSLDVDYIEAAGAKLGSAGLFPRLAQRDALEGAAEFGPYDHILSTVAAERIPDAWRRDLVPGGRLLVDLKIMNSCGNLVLLTKMPDGSLQGRFDRGYAAFMGMRHDGVPAGRPVPPQRAEDRRPGRARPTHVPGRIWEHTLPWFLAGLRMPERLSFGMTIRDGTPRTAVLTGPGARAEVDLAADEGEPTEVRTSGSYDIWSVVESAWEDWVSWGRPGWEQFGLTVAPDGDQVVWFGHPGSTIRWGVR